MNRTSFGLVPRAVLAPLSVGAALSVCAVLASAAKGAEPTLPAVDTFAPLEDLVSQLDALRESLEPALKSAESWTQKREKIEQDAGLAAVLAETLRQSEAPPPQRQAGAAIVSAASRLAAAQDHAGAVAALAAWGPVGEAAGTNLPPGDGAWQGPADLHRLMEQVAALAAKLRRGITGSRFARTAAENGPLATSLAAVGHATQFNRDYVEDEGSLGAWFGFSGAMRDSAAELRSALRATDQDRARAALDRLEQSCQDCHALFAPEEAN